MSEKATARPWVWIPSIDESHHPTITKKKGRGVIAHILTEGIDKAHEDAMLICKAVNAYDDLKRKADMMKELASMLEGQLDLYGSYGAFDVDPARKLLEQAKELNAS